MAEDVWAKFRSDDEKPPISKGVEGFALAPKDDPWAKFKDQVDPEITRINKEEKYKKSVREAKTSWQKFDAATNLGLNKLKNYLPSLPGHETMEKAISPSLTKGIPVAGQYVPQTPELAKFEKENPKTSMGLNLTGAIGSTAPLAAGAATHAGGGFLKQLMGQTSVAAPLNAADLIAKKGNDATAKEGAGALGMGVASSVIPAGVTSAMGQSARTSYPWNSLKDYVESLKGQKGSLFGSGPSAPPIGAPPPWALNTKGGPQRGENIYPSGAPKLPDPVWATQKGTQVSGTDIPGAGRHLTTVLGGIAGAHSGYDPLIGAMLGTVAGRTAIHPILEALSHTSAGRFVNEAAHHPSTQDILRALAAQTGNKLAPNLNVF